ncbi:MAG: hypothetical protein EZS28_003946 [Streblomastix strix]|uniref:Uncharacterized protein n=1 Tax=Streblomastix strix TaxID=222440 RepID=A0A5J4WZV2_9EUKA|nr:MAG: hypothetical protein EZS28_003946 [Streblomastix strix]
MKDLITIPTKIVPYAEVNEALDELIERKKVYDDVFEYKLENQMKEESKKDILSHIGAKDFSIKFPHTIMLFDDAMSLDASIKSNVDIIYFFDGFNRQKFNLFFYQSSNPLDKETLSNEYVQLCKREALLQKLLYLPLGTALGINEFISEFNSGIRLDSVSVTVFITLWNQYDIAYVIFASCSAIVVSLILFIIVEA